MKGNTIIPQHEMRGSEKHVRSAKKLGREPNLNASNSVVIKEVQIIIVNLSIRMWGGLSKTKDI